MHALSGKIALKHPGSATIVGETQEGEAHGEEHRGHSADDAASAAVIAAVMPSHNFCLGCGECIEMHARACDKCGQVADPYFSVQRPGSAARARPVGRSASAPVDTTILHDRGVVRRSQLSPAEARLVDGRRYVGSSSRQGRLNPLGQQPIGFINETPDGRRVPDGFYAVPVRRQEQRPPSGPGTRGILSRLKSMFSQRDRSDVIESAVSVDSAVSEDAAG